jgi:glycosyltransferase involved in cell wall biosynthesis
LLILGTGPALEEIQKLALSSGAGERIRFLGRVDYDQVPSYLAMCDAFVTASVSEVHPLSVIESMAAGLPVVGIDSPGVSDTVEHGITGYLARNNPAALAAQMTRLCLDASARRRMSAAARRASHQYDIGRTAPQMIRRYRELIQDHPRHERGISERLRNILEKFRQ